MQTPTFWWKRGGLRLFFDAFHESVLRYPATPREAFAVEADYLFYTHLHQDHFSPYRVRDYLRLHPSCSVAAASPILMMLASLGIGWERLKILEGENGLSLPGLKVRNIPTRHIGNNCRFVPHSSFLVEGESRLLVAGDASPTAANFAGRELGLLDCIAAPEYFVRVESAQRMYTKDIDTRSVFLLHTPEEETPFPERPYRIFRPALLDRLEICYNKA